MIDFSNIQNIAIPEGEVYSISRGGVILWQKSKLPLEYQEVEYIQSTGEQYINTGIAIADLTSYYKFVMDVTIDGATNEDSSMSNIFGYMGINGGTMLTLTKNYGLGISSSTGVPWVKGQHYDICMERLSDTSRIATINGTNLTISNQATAYQDRPFGIFNLSPFSNYFYNIYGKLYSFSAWKDGELIQELIPCYRKSDGVVGAYDIVTGNFFTNAGAGEFLYG